MLLLAEAEKSAVRRLGGHIVNADDSWRRFRSDARHSHVAALVVGDLVGIARRGNSLDGVRAANLGADNATGGAADDGADQEQRNGLDPAIVFAALRLAARHLRAAWLLRRYNADLLRLHALRVGRSRRALCSALWLRLRSLRGVFLLWFSSRARLLGAHIGCAFVAFANWLRQPRDIGVACSVVGAHVGVRIVAIVRSCGVQWIVVVHVLIVFHFLQLLRMLI